MAEFGATEPTLSGATGATGPTGDFVGVTGAAGPTGAGTAYMPTPIRAYGSRPSDGWHSHSSLHAIAHHHVVEAIPVGLQPASPTALDAAIFFLALCALVRTGCVALKHLVGVLLRLPLRST